MPVLANACNKVRINVRSEPAFPGRTIEREPFSSRVSRLSIGQSRDNARQCAKQIWERVVYLS
jgi:hypothetical protein